MLGMFQRLNIRLWEEMATQVLTIRKDNEKTKGLTFDSLESL